MLTGLTCRPSACLFLPLCLPALLTSLSHGCHRLRHPGLLEEPSVLRQTLPQSHSLSRHHKPLPRSASASPSRPCWASSVGRPRAEVIANLGNWDLGGRACGRTGAGSWDLHVEPASQWVLLPTVLPAGTGASHPSAESWGPLCQLYPDLVTATPCTGKKHSQSVCFSPDSPHLLLGPQRQEWAGQGWAGLQRPAGLCLCWGFSSLAGFLDKQPGRLWGQSQTHPIMGLEGSQWKRRAPQSQAVLRNPAAL